MLLSEEIQHLKKEKENLKEKYDIEVMTAEALEEHIISLETKHTNMIVELKKEHQHQIEEHHELKVKWFKAQKSKELDKWEITTLKNENSTLKDDVQKSQSIKNDQRLNHDGEVKELKRKINNLSKENKDQYQKLSEKANEYIRKEKEWSSRLKDIDKISKERDGALREVKKLEKQIEEFSEVIAQKDHKQRIKVRCSVCSCDNYRYNV